MWHGFTTAWQVWRTACLKAGGGSFGQLERCSSECQSVAQTDQGERSTRLGWIGMFRWYVLPSQHGKKPVSGVARLKPWSARALRKRESERCSARPEKAKCQPGLFGRACFEKQRRRSDVAWFHNGTASLENGMFKGRGR